MDKISKYAEKAENVNTYANLTGQKHVAVAYETANRPV